MTQKMIAIKCPLQRLSYTYTSNTQTSSFHNKEGSAVLLATYHPPCMTLNYADKPLAQKLNTYVNNTLYLQLLVRTATFSIILCASYLADHFLAFGIPNYDPHCTLTFRNLHLYSLHMRSLPLTLMDELSSTIACPRCCP